jgi:hypothetical protein
MGKESISSIIIYTKKFALSLFLFMGIGTSLTIAIALKLSYPSIGYLGFFIFFICPILVMKYIRKFFEKKMEIIFHNDYVNFQLFNLKTGIQEDQNDFKYNEIESCGLVVTESISSTLSLNFCNGDKVLYTFIETNSNTHSEGSIGEIIYKLMSSYSTTLNGKNKIAFKPSFYATQTGKICIIGLTILLIFAIIFHLIYALKSLPFTLFIGLALFFQIIARRKKDIALYEKMKSS